MTTITKCLMMLCATVGCPGILVMWFDLYSVERKEMEEGEMEREREREFIRCDTHPHFAACL